MFPPEGQADLQIRSMKCSDKSIKDTETMLPVGNQKFQMKAQ